MNMTDSPVRPHPDVAIVVFGKRTRAEVTQSVALLKVSKLGVEPAAHAFISGNPNAPIPALQEYSNEIVHQSIFDHVMHDLQTILPENPSPLSSNPQRSIPIAKYI